MSTPIQVALIGASGRMGLSLVRGIVADSGLRLCAAIVGPDSAHLGRDIGELAGLGPLDLKVSNEFDNADVLIDFSAPRVMQQWAAHCARSEIAMVSGTTNLNEADHMALGRAAESVPVLWAPNMSIGVQLLYALTEQAAAAIGNRSDIEIIEAHHRFKADAPSGTALEIGRVVNKAMGRDPEHSFVRSREGRHCRREAGDIGFSAIRSGDIIGEHTILFGLDGERFEITHRASRREAFVNGALLAARWLVGQPAGQYEFTDALGLN